MVDVRITVLVFNFVVSVRNFDITIQCQPQFLYECLFISLSSFVFILCDEWKSKSKTLPLKFFWSICSNVSTA